MGKSTTNNAEFFRNLVRRQIRQDYLENLTGFAWLVIQPLMLLAVYAFVFGTIFKARLPESAGVDFVPFLAVAFWPWTAFSEAVIKASSSISGNAALISKVAFATEQLPLASVTSTFIMNSAGYLAVLLVLEVAGTHIHWLFFPGLVLALLLLWLLACSIALIASALQVFIKDLAQILPPLMTFWFFTTPIVYSPDILPDTVASLLQWNVMSWVVGQIRSMMLHGVFEASSQIFLIPIGILIFAALALGFFRRVSGHFEDFL